MEYNKYVFMSEFYDAEEKKKLKVELDKIMAKVNDLKKCVSIGIKSNLN